MQETYDPVGVLVLFGAPAVEVLSAFPTREDLEQAICRAQCAHLRLDDRSVRGDTIVGRVLVFARWKLETVPEALGVVVTDPHRPTGFGFDPDIEDEPAPRVLAAVRTALAAVHPNFRQAVFDLLLRPAGPEAAARTSASSGVSPGRFPRIGSPEAGRHPDADPA